MKAAPVQTLVLALICLPLSACNRSMPKEKSVPAPKIVTVTTAQLKPITLTERYFCRIESHHHIKIRAPGRGKLEAIQFKAGQTVRQNDLLYRVTSIPGTAKPDEPAPEGSGKVLFVKAPFDGIVGSSKLQKGSLVEQGEELTNLSDNSQMWVYFNVSEARYLNFKADQEQHKNDLKIELVMDDGKKFDQPGTFGAIEAQFDAVTGDIPFRADFPNPDHLLRHGQFGSVLISRVKNDAIVIPQRATFDVGDKWYVYVVDKDNVVHQREVVVQDQVDDLLVVKRGIDAGDKIILDGIRRVRDGSKLKSEGGQSATVVASLKRDGE